MQDRIDVFFNWNREVLLPIIVIWVSIFATFYICEADDLKLDVIEMRTNYFGDRLGRVTFRLTSNDPFKGTLRWNLTFKERILTMAERSITIKNRNVIFHADLKIPPVKENVVLPVGFVLTIYDKISEHPVLSYRQKLWVFSEHPFRCRQRQLQKLDIYLFDPPKKTSALFEMADIPFKPICCMEALTRADNGLIILGEGLSFGKYRGLTEIMMSLASAGNTVLCLAPNSGVFPLPSDPGKKFDAIQGIHLRKSDVIHDLDERLDIFPWSAHFNDGAGISGIGFRIQKNKMYGEVIQGDRWPWIEFDYNKPGAKIIFCGFSLLEAWERDPAPRYLLAAILQDLAGNK